MQVATSARKSKRPLRALEWTLLVVAILLLVGVDLTFYFWPFRYREVHPLLESTFRSRVDVKGYHRTYFPHPGFVAEGVTFYRHSDTRLPPLATMDSLTVVGTWNGLILHPHTLYELRVQGLHVQIPPPGTPASGTDFAGGVLNPAQERLAIETIVADGTSLDILRQGKPPLRFSFPVLQVHDVRAHRPLQFVARLTIPGPQGVVETSGSLGPFKSNAYTSTPVQGTWSLQNADLKRVSELTGHVAARGEFSGTVSAVEVQGHASIPDFRVSDKHTVRLDANYRLRVKVTEGDVEIENAQVRTGDSTITATGSVAGTPKKVTLTIATEKSHVEQLLDIIEEGTPSVAGYVSFHAAADFQEGPQDFLKRLNLEGQVSLDQVRFVEDEKRQEMDALSARVRKPDAGKGSDPVEVTAQASSHTTFHDGMASFPDIRVTFPGVAARLHGTFNLLSTGVHLTGDAALQRSLSHAETGWKSVLLKPLAPFFRHKDAGAVVPIAVTGTADKPQLRQDVLHDK